MSLTLLPSSLYSISNRVKCVYFCHLFVSSKSRSARPLGKDSARRKENKTFLIKPNGGGREGIATQTLGIESLCLSIPTDRPLEFSSQIFTREEGKRLLFFAPHTLETVSSTKLEGNRGGRGKEARSLSIMQHFSLPNDMARVPRRPRP